LDRKGQLTVKSNKEHVRISVSDDESVHAFVMRPEQGQARDVVFVFSHGFTVDGTESARHFLVLAHALLHLGCSVILFDYRGSGYSDRSFEDMTLETEISDLGIVLDFAHDQFPGYEIGVWAESFGCAVAAHTLADRSDVAMIIMWSLSADLYRRYQARLGRDISERGYAYANGFKVNHSFLDSLKDRDTFAAIRDMSIPCLLVHGDADPVASIELSRTAHLSAPDNTTLCEIEGGNHGFEAQSSQFSRALECSIDWIRAQAIFGPPPS
jgi:pimeloyl-ACP methyl ester carboxylesterase